MRCPLVLICESPSKNKKWACNGKYSDQDRKKMCVAFVQAVNKGLIEIEEGIILRQIASFLFSENRIN